MKRWIVYAVAAAALLALRPKEMKDVSGLIPIELLYINKEAGWIRVETDTGNFGVGRDLEAALKDLENTAPGKIFLETADYLIVTGDTAYLLPKLVTVLRPAAEVCLGIEADAQAVEYLKAHRSQVTLNGIRGGAGEIPTLIRSGERYYFGQSRKLISQA